MDSVDLHCDTLTHLFPWEDLRGNHLMVSIPKLRQADSLLQCCAIFVPTGRYPPPLRDALSKRRYRRVLRNYHRVLSHSVADITPVLSFKDIECCRSSGKIGLLLTVEDGGAIGPELSDFQRAYTDGVRLVTLTWNHPNRLGFPHSKDSALMDRGLTPFGIAALEEMERLGIIIDVSHLSDGGFRDVAEHTNKPFIASHSNSRAVTDHTRNLTDDMIRIIADRGGVIGLNYYPWFLNYSRASRLEDMVRHVLHIRNVGGPDVLALGSDFDGIDGKLDIRGPQDVPKLYAALQRAGLGMSDLEKMWQGNALRILRTLL